ncbi:5-formyltetrahydrofolate cyclo-ligase [Propionibacteriaceae bacterium Y2011]|uniref:5-formyltetrahydrofolate cyclo-ligase n=1 Tax=Microlunatus sp. Y2014 TaxID=3418488 RepID=UPI003B4535A6
MSEPTPSPATLNEADQRAIRQAKDALRNAVQVRRNARDTAVREADDHARTQLVQEFIGDLARRELTVACYLSRGTEPDTLELISWLTAQGCRVLLPVLGNDERPLPSDDSGRRRPAWGVYTGPGHLQLGSFGVGEPDGEVLDACALLEAHIIILSGLAGNEYGHRLGRGGAWYDRALAEASDMAVRVMLLNDDELFDAVPVEPNDRHVDVIITPTRTVMCEPEDGDARDY